AFLPDEDQGYFINLIQGPDGTSLNYTKQIVEQAEQQLLDVPEIRATFAVGGVGFSGNAPNRGFMFAPLQPWTERTNPEQTVTGILNRVRGSLMAISQAPVLAVNPPTIQSLGSVGGFVFQLQDRGGRTTSDISTLDQMKGELLNLANQTPELQ
ncbi:efflux RND transporter permease subunit, partial [Cronobacter muytjensii]|uniref:efflux RND transporter permease subunit n=1 Tax=Cronobacter muytjensii TaxID=413501 RepID=UPI0034D77C43